ncbi:hypothetical protein [Neptuniibacter halophilus]|uniref:hypothetical protein n=1 Tax=Neptuniibacter halophilus TaxID=651666 RepID=UPI0025742078|nr:hypothetical protein [Neptuniibacter halophilus]
MKTIRHLSLSGLALSTALLLPALAQAEDQHYTCSYTEASYTAPFMKNPAVRKCPESHCSYQVMISNGQASINGVVGFMLEQSETMLKLSRTARDPIMGGMDSTVLTINKTDMSFESIKTTTPDVTLTTRGRCS